MIMSSKINSVYLQIANVVAIVGSIVFNALVNILPLNGITTGEVSNAYPNLFTPANYVFAIWGAIYTLLFVFMFYQIRTSQRDSDYLQEIGFLYLLSAVVNIAWLTVFHYSYPAPNDLIILTTVPIFGLFLTLLYIYLRLGVGVKDVSRGVRLAVQIPLSVYLGWLSVATIANTASVLNYLGRSPGIPIEVQEMWTAAVIIVAFLITFLMLIRRKDFAFGLVVIWATLGIASKQMASPLIYYTALGVAVVIFILIVILPLLKKESYAKYYILS
ncbi:MAG: tryptophan-rich sensory protein [Candidatus Thorarchaeota archaeon]